MFAKQVGTCHDRISKRIPLILFVHAQKTNFIKILLNLYTIVFYLMLVVVLESLDIRYHQSKGFTSKAAEIRLIKNFKVKKEYWL